MLNTRTTRRTKMVFNITVIQQLKNAKVDLFEIIKNNHEYLLNSFKRVIEECEQAKNTVEPKYLYYIQHLKNQWVYLREEYIGTMAYEYKHVLEAWKPWHIIANINKSQLNTGELVEHMLSEDRFKVPWPDYGTYYQKLLAIQSSFIKQFPIEVAGKQKFTK